MPETAEASCHRPSRDPKQQGPLRARVGEPAWGGRAWGRPQSCAAGDAVHEHAPDGLQRDAYFLLRAHARCAAHLRPRPASLSGKQVTCACSTSSSPRYHIRRMRAALGERATGPVDRAGWRPHARRQQSRGRRRRTSLARRKRKRESSTARPAAAARARCAAHAGSSTSPGVLPAASREARARHPDNALPRRTQSSRLNPTAGASGRQACWGARAPAAALTSASGRPGQLRGLAANGRKRLTCAPVARRRPPPPACTSPPLPCLRTGGRVLATVSALGSPAWRARWRLQRGQLRHGMDAKHAHNPRNGHEALRACGSASPADSAPPAAGGCA